MLKSKKIVVIGDLILDKYVYGNVTRLNPESPVALMNFLYDENRLGGAANVANNLKKMKMDILLISKIHQKDFKLISEMLKEQKINYCLFTDYYTPIKTRFVANNQYLLRVDDEKIIFLKNIHIIKTISVIKKFNPDLIVISDYNKGFMTSELVDRLKKLRKLMIVDSKPNNFHIYKNVHILKCNEKEAGFNTTKKLGMLYKTNFIITRGAKGVSYWDKKSKIEKSIPAFKKEVIDVTGAGDVFIAILAAALANGYNLDKSIMLANKGASISVTKFGTSVVTQEEIFDEKIIDYEDLLYKVKELKEKKKKIVLVNGCFDILHIGHIKLLQEAKKRGDILIVALNTDKSIKKLKGNDRPIHTEKERAEILSTLSCVDYVCFFGENTPITLIKDIKPNVIVKGSDYKDKKIPEIDIIKKLGIELKFINIVPNKSSSKIINRLR